MIQINIATVINQLSSLRVGVNMNI